MTPTQVKAAVKEIFRNSDVIGHYSFFDDRGKEQGLCLGVGTDSVK